jgi:hypothetical protein
VEVHRARGPFRSPRDFVIEIAAIRPSRPATISLLTMSSDFLIERQLGTQLRFAKTLKE